MQTSFRDVAEIETQKDKWRDGCWDEFAGCILEVLGV